MTINQMASFVALHNHQSFTKAAESLYTTQSTISKNIAYLEKELGVTLVERKKGGKITITEAGETFFLSFDEILKKLKDTEAHVKYVLPNNKKSYRVGTMETWYIPDLIRMCREELPEELQNIEFIFDTLPPVASNRLIENGQLDFIFTIDPAFATNRYYEKKHIADIHTSIYTSAENPAAKGGTINTDLLEPFVYFISEQLLFRINTQQLDKLFYPRSVMIKEIDSGLSAYMNVLSGYGAAISDSWSLNHFSDRMVSQILDESVVPVIFAGKLLDDPLYNSASEFLQNTIRRWIDLKGGRF